MLDSSYFPKFPEWLPIYKLVAGSFSTSHFKPEMIFLLDLQECRLKYYVIIHQTLYSVFEGQSLHRCVDDLFWALDGNIFSLLWTNLWPPESLPTKTPHLCCLGHTWAKNEPQLRPSLTRPVFKEKEKTKGNEVLTLESVLNKLQARKHRIERPCFSSDTICDWRTKQETCTGQTIPVTLITFFFLMIMIMRIYW